MRAVHPTGQSAEGMMDSGPDAPELEEPPPSRPPDDQLDSRAAADPHEQKPEDWFPFDNFSTAAIAAFATDHLSRKGLKGLLEILRNPAFKVSDLAAQTMQGLMGHVERRLPFAKTTLVELTTVQQIVRKRTQTAVVNGRRRRVSAKPSVRLVKKQTNVCYVSILDIGRRVMNDPVRQALMWKSLTPIDHEITPCTETSQCPLLNNIFLYSELKQTSVGGERFTQFDFVLTDEGIFQILSFDYDPITQSALVALLPSARARRNTRQQLGVASDSSAGSASSDAASDEEYVPSDGSFADGDAGFTSASEQDAGTASEGDSESGEDGASSWGGSGSEVNSGGDDSDEHSAPPMRRLRQRHARARAGPPTPGMVAVLRQFERGHKPGELVETAATTRSSVADFKARVEVHTCPQPDPAAWWCSQTRAPNGELSPRTPKLFACGPAPRPMTSTGCTWRCSWIASRQKPTETRQVFTS